MILTYELNRSVCACLRQLPVSKNLRRRKKHFVWELCFWNKKSSMLQNATTMISPPKLWRVTLCKVPPWYRGHCRDLPPQPYRCLGGLPSLQQKLICSSGVLAGPANMTADTHEGACQKKKFSPLAESLTGEMLEMDESVCKTGFAQICLCERPTVSYECKNNISTLTDSTKQLLNIEVLSDR